jgi:hypothetical protein
VGCVAVVFAAYHTLWLTQARLYGIFMMLIITISTMTFVLETETSVKAVMGGVFAVSEVCDCLLLSLPVAVWWSSWPAFGRCFAYRVSRLI